MTTEEKELQEITDTDLKIYYALCNKEEKQIFLTQMEKLTLDQLVRIFCICFALDLKGVLFAILAKLDSIDKLEEFTDSLNKVRHDYDKVIGFINDFIAKIEDDILKKIVLKDWAKKKEHITKENFYLAQLAK